MCYRARVTSLVLPPHIFLNHCTVPAIPGETLQYSSHSRSLRSSSDTRMIKLHRFDHRLLCNSHTSVPTSGTISPKTPGSRACLMNTVINYAGGKPSNPWTVCIGPCSNPLRGYSYVHDSKLRLPRQIAATIQKNAVSYNCHDIRPSMFNCNFNILKGQNHKTV